MDHPGNWKREYQCFGRINNEKKKNTRRYLLISTALLLSLKVSAQETPLDTSISRKDAVAVFIDCDRCDMNYIREEIPYINYVRDVKEAQIYIRETRETAGSGGYRYTYIFLGQEEMAGKNDTLVYTSRPDDTRDLQRVWRTQMMKMGLMPYVARTPLYKEVIIDPTESVERQEVVDRWNNWVFRLGAEPRFEGEESRQDLSLRSEVSANKITHDWKLEFEFDNRFTRTRYIYDDTLNTADKSYQAFEILVVKSIGEHWSAGINSEILSSSYTNTRFSVDFMPALEYNIFPYDESTHHQLRFLYSIGGSYRAYNDTTIYNQIEEMLYRQQLQVAYEVQEKWGTINLSLEGSNFLHDFSKNRLELNGYISVRLLKGLSIQVRGAVARINDQLSLVKGEASEAEILLQLQELETSFNVRGEIGLTYTFGSIYNNIVNPRFGNGRRRY